MVGIWHRGTVAPQRFPENSDFIMTSQLRNSHHRSVSGFAENCAMVGISSLSATIRFAGFVAEGRREVRAGGCIFFVNERHDKLVVPQWFHCGIFIFGR